MKTFQGILGVYFLGLALLPLDAQEVPFVVEKVSEGWKNPWSLAFLPDGRAVISEKAGKLWLWDGVKRQEIAGLPTVRVVGQGGFLDVRPDPDFQNSPWLYFSYAASEGGKHGTRLARAKLGADFKLTDFQVLWDLPLKTSGGNHFGSRITFAADGTLLFSVGERGEQDRAQDLKDGAGKIHRIHKDGTIPKDNPFLNQPQALPSIYSYGHRNPQGLVTAPDGTIWATEHGPQGGDEVNVILPGKNYGWPVITYGRQYGSGAPIGEGTEKAGMVQPLKVWTPSIAPSGLAYYRGKAFPGWENSLLSGNLAGQRLSRLTIKGQAIVSEEQFLQGQIGRIREVAVGPEGWVYLLTDGASGTLYRLKPKGGTP